MSLRARLTAVLLALFLLVGVVLFIGFRRGSKLYFEEVHYTLNRDVAAHLAESLKPFTADGSGLVDEDAIKALFMDVMHVNPSLEVYLLDARGRILAYDAPEGHVVRASVDLVPVLAAISTDGAEDPLRGDDPRSAGGRKPFSAAELRTGGALDGYLYVILGGETHQAIATSLRSSAMLRDAAILLLGSVLLAAVAGTICIVVLVRPLRRLRDAMTTLQEGQVPAGLNTTAHDEVGTLAATFEVMAGRIAAQIDELKRVDRRRREFVANVSHDLRTPTGAIQGYLETLTMRWDRLDRAEREQFLRSALRQTERLGSLVERLFELSRLEAREYDLRKECFSLSELVQDVVAKFEVPARKKGVRLRARVDRNVPPIEADIGLIERALDNLIDNGIRYTPPGGDVRVGVEQVPGGVGVRVSDSGPGISAEDLPRVFDRFYRVAREGVAREPGDSAGGAGLGLAIAKRILDLHDAALEVESPPGKGASFSFVLSPALAARSG